MLSSRHCLSLLFMCEWVTTAHILVFHPIYAGSHHHILLTISKHLVTLGHNVTIIKFKESGHTISKSAVNVVEMPLQDNLGICGNYITEAGEFDIDKSLSKGLWENEAFLTLRNLEFVCTHKVFCDTVHHDQALAKILNSNPIDLVIVDLKGSEGAFSKLAHLQVPMVAFWGFPFSGAETNLIGSGTNPMIVPQLNSKLGLVVQWFDLFQNLVVYSGDCLVSKYLLNPVTELFWSDWSQSSRIEHILGNLNLILVNSSPLLESPRKMAPNVKYVPGLTLNPPQPLPQLFEDFLNQAPDGVILFSIGKTLGRKGVPVEFKRKLIQALALLPQKAILQLDNEDITEDLQTSDILALPWLPQQDLLRSGKVKVFFSHGGISSYQEAVFFDVPILAMPLFEDQFENAKAIEERGVGIRIGNKHDIKAREIAEKIQELITNQTYAENMHQLSLIFRATLDHSSSLDLIGFWLESVIHVGHLEPLRVNTRDFNMIISIVQIAFVLISIKVSWEVRKTIKHTSS